MTELRWDMRANRRVSHSRSSCKLKLDDLKGQSHEKVGELRVWRGSLGPN
jgi:hypothetical protein